MIPIRKRLPAWSVALLVGILLLISACSDMPVNQAGDQARAQTNQVRGTFSEYPLPQDKSGIMRPAIDSHGRVWFGEMGQNYLASFDPRSKTFEQITPPQGQAGIMGIIVAPDNTVWYAEQYANYIGHYNPINKHFDIYTLPTVTKPDPTSSKQTLKLPVAPNELLLDRQGNIWFTEMNADAIGKLNVKTGTFSHYPLSKPRTVQKLSPYSITQDRQGKIWFTNSGTNTIGSLAPTNGSLRFYTPPTPADQDPFSLMEITSDPSGMLWISTFNTNNIIHFDPHRESFTTYAAPGTSRGIPGIYGLLATSSNDIWATVSASNSIVHFNVKTKAFDYYPIPSSNCTPLGISQAPDKSFWFTESATNQLGVLKP
ncbi:virginiamycin B lyase family protein [Dictyobacter halimunensis]